ncbi:hypothetical protein [Glutamicibacter arilaitensis]|uniref:hypothetical protein n=1 Tax=Glutamicibacter arilaitensis TaxID=256701 RepID=UPI003FD0BAA5
MNANTNPLLLAIAHQLQVANLLTLEKLKTNISDKAALRRIAKEMDRLPELQNKLIEDEAAAASLPKDSGPELSGVSPNTARAAAGLPAYPGPKQSLDPGIYGRNLRAFTLETLHTEVGQLRRKADNTAAREALHAVQNILDRHINANIAEGNKATTKTPPPVPARKSYRDPDLSDRWLAEAEHRATHDDSARFTTYDSRMIIGRLVAEVRRLNEMLSR